MAPIRTAGFTGLVHATFNVVTAEIGKTGQEQIIVIDLLLLNRAIPAAKRFDSKFMLGPDFYDELLSRLDLNGRPIASVDADGTLRLWNTPVGLIPAMDSLTDGPSQPVALYGDPRHGLMMTRRALEIQGFDQGLAVVEEHVSWANVLEADLFGLRVTEHVAFGFLDDAGIAVLKTAAT
jgi:HK97 family phage major capsid protein